MIPSYHQLSPSFSTGSSTNKMTIDATGQSAPSPAAADWEEKVAATRARAREVIPRDWLLPDHILGSLQHPLEEHPNRLMELDIPRRSGILTEAEIQITEAHDVSSLLKQLASGDLTAVDVTRAFSKRAAIAQQLVYALMLDLSKKLADANRHTV